MAHISSNVHLDKGTRFDLQELEVSGKIVLVLKIKDENGVDLITIFDRQEGHRNIERLSNLLDDYFSSNTGINDSGLTYTRV